MDNEGRRISSADWWVSFLYVSTALAVGLSLLLGAMGM